MEGSGKRKRGDEVSEDRLFKKFEALESRLMELWEADRDEDTNSLETLNAGVSDIISFVSDQINHDRQEDFEDGVFNEVRNFKSEAHENSQVEEIDISSEEPQGDQDVVFLNEQFPKLGEFQTNSHSKVNLLHPDIQEIWTVWTRCGIPFKDKRDLMEKYSPPKFLKAPEINEEILVTLHKRPVEKDNYIRTSQEILSSALTALGTTMSILLTENDQSDRIKVLNNLNDTAKLLTELFHFDTEKRRSSVISWKREPVQSFLVNTKPDEFLFGKNLKSKIKLAQQTGVLGQLTPYVFKQNNNRPYRYFPSPYHWFGRMEEEEEDQENEKKNFVLNPLKQEVTKTTFACKKEEPEETPVKLE